MTVQDIKAELDLAGTWTEVTSYVRAPDGINLRHGKSGEGSQVDYSRCVLTLDNTDGRFSPRLPTGAYYGTIGRNTPLRVSLPYGSSYLHVPGDRDDRATTPDSAALSITGDIDVRVQADMHWCEDLYLAGKWETTSDERSWLLSLDAYGLVHWSWSTAGTSATESEVKSTAPLPVTCGTYAIRVTHDVNNGASGNDVTFYYSTDFSSWTQLGDAVTSSGTTSIYDGTASVEVGNVNEAAVSGTTTLWSQERKVLRFELYTGIAGTVVANPRFDTATAAAASFADTASSPNTWTMSGSSAIDDRDYLFCGEVAEWPPTSDISGNDVTVTIEAAGPLRRLSQGESPVDSAFYRARTTAATLPRAYWPCEDGEGSSQFASPTDGVAAGWWTGTDPTLETYDGFYGSDKLPTVGTSRWTFAIPGRAYGTVSLTPANKVVQFLLSIPDSGISSAATVMTIVTDSSGRTIDINYSTGSSGGLAWACYDADGAATTGASGTITGLNGGDWMVSLYFDQGGDVTFDATLYVADANNADDAASSVTDTVTGLSSGLIRNVIVNADRADLGSTSIGHISVHNENLSLDDATFRDAYLGETAGARFYRLCGEAGITFRSIGTLGLVSSTPGQTVAMGPQRPEQLVTLLRECEAADRGQMYELTSALGLGLRTRESIYNQTARMDVDYASNELSAPLSPTDDDQNVRNDVTITRKVGSSSRAVVATGALSIQPPPDGVGTYSHGETVNVLTDTQLADQSGWVAHQGTVDEARYPNLSFNLTGNELVANATLAAQLRRHTPGDRVTVDNPPSTWLPPDTISQIAVGSSQKLDGFQHTMVLNTVPESPYQVVRLDDDDLGRLDTGGSELAASATSGATSLTVLTTEYPIWTTDGAEAPWDVEVGGEVITVTAVASSASDVFNRTEASSWGSADAGGAWTNTGGSASDFSVAAGTGGVHTLTSVNVNRFSTLAVAQDDLDVYVTFSTSALATGASQHVALVARWADSSNYYLLRAELATTAVITLSLRKVVAGVDTELDTATMNAAHVATTQYRMRLQVSGSTLNGGFWPVSLPEPVDVFHVSATDTALTAAGSVGVRSLLATGNTNVNPTANYDNFEVINPQTFTVTRSTNGVTKAHSAAADVRLSTQQIIGL